MHSLCPSGSAQTPRPATYLTDSDLPIGKLWKIPGVPNSPSETDCGGDLFHDAV